MDIKSIKQKYDANIPLNQIASKHHITLNQLKYLIKTQGWHRKRRGGTKGNKGGRGVKGNKGNKNAHPPKNNQNATVTGYYSKFRDLFSEDEKAILNNEVPTDLEQLQHEIQTCDMLEYRYLNKINELKKKKELIIVSMNKYGTTVSTEVRRTDELIDKYNKSLLLVQNERRKAIQLAHNIKIDNKKIEQELNRENKNIDAERIQIINTLPNEEGDYNETN